MSPVLGIIASSTQQGRGGGPIGAYDALASITVPSGGLSSIIFAGVPTGYSHLQVRCMVRTNRSDVQDVLMFRFNGDTNSNYAWHYLGGDGATAVVGNGSSTSQPWTALIAGNSAGSNIFGVSVVDILDYAKTNKVKTIRTASGIDDNSSGGRVYNFGNLWNNTAAITNVQITPIYGTTINEFSSFALYGVK